jgi:NAD-dependent SIR2 family protein deacetylase
MVTSWTTDVIRDRLPALTEDLKAGDVTLFVGAGLSHNAGLPLWEELMAPLAAELGLESTTNPVAIAQYYVDAHAQGRYLLNKHVVRQLRKSPVTFSLPHALIKELPLRNIITTNFDELVERALSQEPERSHRVIVADEDLAYLSGGELPVLKVNGSIVRPDSLVLTRQDFESYSDKRPAITDYLRTTLATSTILFIGTSMRDPAFERFNAEVLRKLGQHRRAFYLLVHGASKFEVQDYKTRGIELISLDTSLHELGNEVTKFLESFVHVATTEVPQHRESLKLAQAARVDQSRIQIQLEPKYQTLLVSRLGTGLSLQVNPDHVDSTHRYLSIERTDLLDYESGNFVSLRRLHGTNLSERLSSYVVYSESSEKKLSFSQTDVRAYDVSTREPLAVEPFNEKSEMMFTHAFKIFFPNPISPEEEFDLVYRITLPGELQVLSSKNEIMSISLSRIARQVEQLRFSVCLNFRPASASVECLDQEGSRVPLKGPAPRIGHYTPSAWYESSLDLSWSSPPYAIAWGCDLPDSKLYIINYRV